MLKIVLKQIIVNLKNMLGDKNLQIKINGSNITPSIEKPFQISARNLQKIKISTTIIVTYDQT